MSPSQASETCASASSATSPWTFEYTNAVTECQDTVSPVFAQARTYDRSWYARLSSEETPSIEVAMMMASKANPRTAPVEATIASVMAVNESGLSSQADSAPAVTRDHENRTL